MSAAERTGQRDLLYNDWHRVNSLVRYMTQVEAHRCAAIDIDFCEWCTKCHAPLALVEVQKSRTFEKPYTITRNLALLAGIEAWVLSYWTTEDELDIEGMRAQRVAPVLQSAQEFTPAEWAQVLYGMRERHEARDCSSPHALRAAS